MRASSCLLKLLTHAIQVPWYTGDPNKFLYRTGHVLAANECVYMAKRRRIQYVLQLDLDEFVQH